MDFFSRVNDYFKLNETEYSTYNKRYVKNKKSNCWYTEQTTAQSKDIGHQDGKQVTDNKLVVHWVTNLRIAFCSRNTITRIRRWECSQKTYGNPRSTLEWKKNCPERSSLRMKMYITAMKYKSINSTAKKELYQDRKTSPSAATKLKLKINCRGFKGYTSFISSMFGARIMSIIPIICVTQERVKLNKHRKSSTHCKS